LTVISIKYVNPAREGKKFGSIKSVEGETYWVPAGMVSQFQPGTTVDVPTETQKWGANIQNVISGAANATPKRDESGWGRAAPPKFAAPPTQQAPAAPAATNTPVNNKDALIFVTGVVGRAMGSGQYKSGDISDLTHEALKAWFILKDNIA
jgi:hypothetical protein